MELIPRAVAVVIPAFVNLLAYCEDGIVCLSVHGPLEPQFAKEVVPSEPCHEVLDFIDIANVARPEGSSEEASCTFGVVEPILEILVPHCHRVVRVARERSADEVVISCQVVLAC